MALERSFFGGGRVSYGLSYRAPELVNIDVLLSSAVFRGDSKYIPAETEADGGSFWWKRGCNSALNRIDQKKKK